MMDELYGIHSTDCYSDHAPIAPPEDLVFPFNYHGSSSPADIHGRIPVFGTELLMSGASAVSDAASMVAEIQRIGPPLEEEISSTIRAKIASHPLYPKLLEAYIDCQKVGAPPEIVNLLEEIQRGGDICNRNAVVSSCFGSDPELDDFMETYCGILVKYKSDLSRPFEEATSFLNKIETQLNSLCNSAPSTYFSDEGAGSSEEDVSAGEIEVQECSRTNEDRELKDKLLRKYSGYITTLKQEFSKKKKKGKLPKEARQILMDWWNIHYKWPYPTEADKIGLAELTGLDQKQINNWFINQRKRHWKPSDNMQFTVMDSLYGPFYLND